MARKGRSRKVTRRRKLKGGQGEPVKVEDIQVGKKYNMLGIRKVESSEPDLVEVEVVSKEEVKNSDPETIKVEVNTEGEGTISILYVKDQETVNEGSEEEKLFELTEGGRRKRKLKRATRRKH